MKISFKRIASVVLSLAMVMGLFSQIPFSAFAATVTHDVTDDAASKLTFTSNYDVNMQATGFGTEFLSESRLSNNLLKNASFKLLNHNGTSTSISGGTWANVYDGVMDHAGSWAKTPSDAVSFIYSQKSILDSKDENGARAYLTITLDDTYELDEFYLFSAYRASYALYDYEVYVGEDQDGLYTADNLVSAYRYTGYVAGDSNVTIGKLNFGPNGDSNNFAEGQIYTYNGSEKPTGKYIGVKINESSMRFETSGWWLYFCEMGVSGSAYTEGAKVSGDVLSNANLSFSSNYDLSINATNIPVGAFTQEMLESNLVKPDGITLQRLSTDADVTGNIASNSSWDNVIDGVFDYEKGHKSFAYMGTLGDTGAKLTIDLGITYELSDFYMLSTYHACRSFYAYELYVGDSKTTLYNQENLVLSYDYSGYVRNSDTAGKLNTADNSSNAEGQIYNFTGETKPTGQYIGVKITGISQFDIYKQWIYFSELGAHGKPITNVSGDILSNENFNYESYYDVNLNATNIPTSAFTEELVETNIVNPSTIYGKKLDGSPLPALAMGGSVGNQVQLTWDMATDGVIDYGSNHQTGHYVYYYDLTDTGAYITLPLGAEYELSDFYLMSAYHACRSIYQYEIYVGDDEDGLYDASNKVFYYDYSGYVKDNSTTGKLNTAEGGTLSEGQFYAFTGTRKPIGSFIGIKITGISKFSAAPRWLYIAELGAHGTKLGGCDEYEGRDMTVKSSVVDTTIFDDSVMYQETAFFYDGRDEYQLLYPIDEIITVRSYDLTKEYREGKDFYVKDGKLYLTESTSIPLYDNSSTDRLTITGSNQWNLAGYWKTNQWKYQLNISYTHSENWDDNALYVKGLDGKLSEISKFHEKAQSGETTNVVFIGDSITEGCNASGQDNVKVSIWAQDENKVDIPARDTQHNVHVTGWKEYFGLNARPDWANDAWATQVTNALNEKYGDNIVMTNRGIGSTSADWINKYDNIEYLLGEGEGTTNLPTPDIAFIAFGMNEHTNTNERQIRLTSTIVEFLRERNPDCSIVFVSAFVPLLAGNNNLAGHEQAFYEYAEEIGNATVAPVNSVFQSMLSAKQKMDYTGNMLNHPNDFGVNVYADTILAVLEGEEATLELNSNVEGVKPTYLGSTLVGSSVTVTAPEVEGYTFSHFEINGLIVSGDQNNSAVVSLATKKTVTAIYQKVEADENVSVTFVDNNGAILCSTTVAIGTTLDSGFVTEAEDLLPEIFGYTKGTGGFFWNSDPTAPIVSDMVFGPIYVKKTEKVFTLTVNDGEVNSTTHAFDDAFTFTAKGENFSYWMDAVTGAVLSTEATYQGYIPGNIEITAVYDAEVPKKDIVQLNSAVNFIAGDTRYTAILTASTYVPEGAIIEEKGIIFTNAAGYASAGNEITLNMETKQIVKAKKPIDGNFMITYKNIKNGSVRYARAYVTYVLNGKIITEYSNYTAIFNGEVQ